MKEKLINRAIEITTSILEKNAIDCDSPVILSKHNSLVLHFRELEAVAKIKYLGGESPGQHNLLHDYKILNFLNVKKAASLPLKNPISNEFFNIDGYVLFFSKYIPQSEGEFNFTLAFKKLKQVHKVLQSYQLSSLVTVQESLEKLLLQVKEKICEKDDPLLSERTFLVSSFSISVSQCEQVIHGDAQVGNVLRSDNEYLWFDFETACIGDPLWDSATLLLNHKDALTICPDPELLKWIKIRVWNEMAWIFTSHKRGEPVLEIYKILKSIFLEKEK
jgi:hypothetical protein